MPDVNRLLLTLILAILPATLLAQTSYLLKPYEQQAGQVLIIRSSSGCSEGKMVIERGGEKIEGALTMLRGEVGGFDLGELLFLRLNPLVERTASPGKTITITNPP